MSKSKKNKKKQQQTQPVVKVQSAMVAHVESDTAPVVF